MKAQITAIRMLAATAVLLLLAIVLIPRPATADVSLKQGDYVVGTHKFGGAGGDGIYIIDTRLGVIGVFAHDANVRSLQLRALRPLGDVFGGR